MWGTFTSYTPSPAMPHEYVEALWKLETEKNEFRSIFVDQLETLPQSTTFGFRPQPVIRAIGLRWPEQEWKVGLRALRERAEKSREPWSLAALACAVEALGRHIDPVSKKQALDVLRASDTILRFWR
jgi:hypothetical protein